MSLLSDLDPLRLLVEESLRNELNRLVDFDGVVPPARLRDGMAHALLAGGKRLRPLICLASARAVFSDDLDDDDNDDATSLALPAAMALEFVHTYSLVHDDLPALDNDDLRRGQPTVHKKWDEGTAILVGDALLTDAFAIVARSKHNAAQQVLELALASGSSGMVGGQHDDVQNEGKPISEQSHDDLRSIHRRKTGRLFAASAALGAWAANRPDLVEPARAYGAALGFAFQVQDDVIDVEGDPEKGGKGLGRDEKLNKLTTVRALGLDGAKALARTAAEDAVRCAQALGPRNDTLIALARFAASRTH
jgi:geranylgeranyl diphosphate synthase type II